MGLRDKLTGFVTELNAITYSLNPLELDAINALMALGIGKPIAEKAVKKVIASNSDSSIQEIIKQALKNI